MRWFLAILVVSLTVSVGACTGTVTIEPTDISSVQEGATREKVERLLGNPVEVKQSQDLTLAVYGYDQGLSGSYDVSGVFIVCNHPIACLLMPIMLPVAHVISGVYEHGKLSKIQRGYLCVAYREDQSVAWYAPVPPGKCQLMLNANVQYSLGLRHDQTDAERWKWMCGAAIQGHATAQHTIAYWHRENRNEYWPAPDITSDKRKAYMWYSLASRNGHSTADQRRDDLITEMTPAEIAEAERLVREWKPDPASCDLEVNQAQAVGEVGQWRDPRTTMGEAASVASGSGEGWP